MSAFAYESAIRGETDEWYTPPEIFEALGETFDLDPCSPEAGPVPWVPARRFLSPIDNGLWHPWDGFVWMNPPYGTQTGDWVERLAAHGAGIALVFARTDTRWFHDAARTTTAMLFLEGRIRFIRPDGTRGDAPGAPSVLVGFGERAALALHRARRLGSVLERAS